MRASLLLLLLLPVAAVAAAAAEPGERLVVELHVGGDGWAVAAEPVPPGYRVAAVEGAAAEPPAAAARPLLAALLPDPMLWERLQALPLSPPRAVAAHGLRVVETGLGRLLVGYAAGEPGGVVRVVLEPAAPPAAAAGGAVDMVIVAPDHLAGLAERLAELHRERQGLRVEVVTLSRLDSTVEPAGEPPSGWGLCPGDRLPRGYPAERALRLLQLARDAAGRGAGYLLLIGTAWEVPPLYYCSPILSSLVDPREGVVASDYYYADPDGDGVVELAVGRLPFNDTGSLEAYISALERWMEGGDWVNLSLVAGGSPFAYTLLTGEAAAAQASRLLYTLGLHVDSLLLTKGNYDGVRLTGYLGRYGLYYIMAHGTGSAVLDYSPGGLWNMYIDEKLHAADIGYGLNPAVYMLPACRNGYWDTDLARPPFEPPSLGQALLSHGAAIAYLGFSRVAIEVIDSVSLYSGRLELGLAGADRLLLEYLDKLRGSATLGEAWLRALNAYAQLPSSKYRAYLAEGEEVIGDLVLREAVFLGDPAAPNPWSSGGRQPPRPAASVEGGVTVGAQLLGQLLARFSSGALPAGKPDAEGRLAVTLTGPCPDTVYSSALRRVTGMFLIGLEADDVEEVEPLEGGGCRVTVRVDTASPGLHVLTLTYNGTIAHVYYIAAGAVATGNGTIVLYGLDMLSVVGDEPLQLLADGRQAATLPGGAPGLVLDARSCCPGASAVEVRPLYDTMPIYGGDMVYREYLKLLPLYRVQLEQRQPPPWERLALHSPTLAAAGLASAGVAAAAVGARMVASRRRGPSVDPGYIY